MTVTIKGKEVGEYTCTVKTDSSIKSFPTSTTPGIYISGKLQLGYPESGYEIIGYLEVNVQRK